MTRVERQSDFQRISLSDLQCLRPRKEIYGNQETVLTKLWKSVKEIFETSRTQDPIVLVFRDITQS